MRSDTEAIRVLVKLLAPTTKVLPSHIITYFWLVFPYLHRVDVMVGGWMEGVLSSFYATGIHIFKEDLY